MIIEDAVLWALDYVKANGATREGKYTQSLLNHIEKLTKERDAARLLLKDSPDVFAKRADIVAENEALRAATKDEAWQDGFHEGVKTIERVRAETRSATVEECAKHFENHFANTNGDDVAAEIRALKKVTP